MLETLKDEHTFGGWCRQCREAIGAEAIISVTNSRVGSWQNKSVSLHKEISGCTHLNIQTNKNLAKPRLWHWQLDDLGLDRGGVRVDDSFVHGGERVETQEGRSLLKGFDARSTAPSSRCLCSIDVQLDCQRGSVVHVRDDGIIQVVTALTAAATALKVADVTLQRSRPDSDCAGKTTQISLARYELLATGCCGQCKSTESYSTCIFLFCDRQGRQLSNSETHVLWQAVGGVNPAISVASPTNEGIALFYNSKRKPPKKLKKELKKKETQMESLHS